MKQEILRFHELTIRNEYQEQMTGLNMVLCRGEGYLCCSHDRTGRSIAGIFQGDNYILDGQFFLEEKEQTFCTKSLFRENGIYFVDSHVKFMESLNLAENIFFLRNNNLKKVWLNEKAILLRTKELFRYYGLSLEPTRKAKTLRAMDKVLLELVRLANQSPKMLVISNLSFICSQKELRELIDVLLKIREAGISLFIYDSNPEYFLELADTLLFARKGTVIKKVSDRKDFGRYWNRLGEKSGQSISVKEEEHREKQPEQENAYCRFSWTSPAGASYSFIIYPGEILYFPSDGWEHQQAICRGMLGLGDGGVLVEMDGHKKLFSQPEKLMKKRIVFWGTERIKEEMFPNLSMEDNILMPTIRRISHFGFYHSGKQFIFRDSAFLVELETLKRNSSLSDEDIFKILCFRWQLYHPRVLIAYNVLSRFDPEMKRWMSDRLLEMSKRRTGLVLLETAEETAESIADRVIKIGL